MKKKYTLKMIINSQDYRKISSVFLFKYFFIPLAWPITWFFLLINLSPNQVTLIRLIITIMAYFLIILGNPIIGFILIYIALIIDCADGQLARVLDKASYFGKFFDGWVDCIFEISFPLIIAFYLLKIDGGHSIIILGLLAGLMNALYWITLLRYSLNKPYMKEYSFPKLFNKVSQYLDGRFLVDWFDIKYFIFPIFVIFNILEYFIVILFIVNTLLFIIYSIQRFYKGYYLLKVHKKSMSSKT